ncbi:MAG: hypothetical protein AAFQ63_14310 [Cyanobacteria bacterium J06621_11]
MKNERRTEVKQERFLGWTYEIVEQPASADTYSSYRSEWRYSPNWWDRLVDGCPKKPDADTAFTIESKTSLGCFNRGCEIIDYRRDHNDLTGENEPDSIRSLHMA